MKYLVIAAILAVSLPAQAQTEIDRDTHPCYNDPRVPSRSLKRLCIHQERRHQEIVEHLDRNIQLQEEQIMLLKEISRIPG